MSVHTSTAKPNAPPVGADCDGPVFHHLSTRAVPADSRLDYWRQQFPATRIERSRSTDGKHFYGDIASTDPWQGALFADLSCDPVVSHFGMDESGTVLLGCVRSGVVHIRHGRDATFPVDEGTGLLLFDCDRPFVTFSKRCAMTYLALPRDIVTQALGCEPVSSGKAVRVMQANTLAAGYLRHLRQLAVTAHELDGEQATGALHTARSLALTLLAGREPRWRSLPGGFDDALLASARHLLALHAGDPQLTAGHLARLLGCSRAHLYRLFERQGQTVTGQLRDIRLHQARRLIKTQPDEPLGMIALRCGYTDLSAFGKAFRRHFGLAPSESRHLPYA